MISWCCCCRDIVEKQTPDSSVSENMFQSSNTTNQMIKDISFLHSFNQKIKESNSVKKSASESQTLGR